MQELAKTIKLIGIGSGQNVIATQLHRVNDICIYHRDDEVYEVFYVKKAQAKEIFDRKYEDRETYPNNEDFGTIAWCYKTKDVAMKKFKNLVKKEELLK